MKNSDPTEYGVIVAYFLFSVTFLILTILQCKFNIYIATDEYGKILFISASTGFILGVIFHIIFKLDKMKKIKSEKEMKKIYHKEVFYFSIIGFVGIILFCMAFYVYISTEI